MSARIGSDRQTVAKRQDKIVAMTADGFSASEIASVLGICRRSVYRARQRREVSRPQPGPLTADELSRAERMLDEGYPYTEVAQALGRGLTTISERFPGRGLSRSEVGDYAAMRRRARQRGLL